MNAAEVEAVIVSILREDCGVTDSSIGRRARFEEDLGMESMGLLNLALEVENRFELCLDEAPDNPPRTLGALTELVLERLGDRTGG
jgi:acyl carrier protein